MKNKKVALSVLSAAVVSSMASSAFAAELKNGIYLGGNVDKFYSLSSFFSDANEEQAIAELEQIGGFSKTVFVVDGKAAFLNDYLKNDDAALQDPTPEMFADGPSYKEIDKDGNIVKVFEPVPPTGGDLVVESVSPIPDITVTAGATDAGLPSEVEVTFNNGTKGTKAVTWDTTGLDLNTPGTYTLTGDVADTDLTATVKVVVEAVELEVESVSAIANSEEKVTISGEVSGGAEKVNVVLKNASGTIVADKSGENAVAVTEGAFTYTTEVGLAAGNYTYEVSAVKGDQTSEVETGTVEVTNVPPTVTSVTAVDSTTLQVVFSEPVSKATAEDVGNYSVRNLAIDNAPVPLVAATDTAVLSEDGKTLTIKIVTPAAKLTNGDYYFIVSQSGTDVADLRGNAVAANTSVAFKGVSTADTTAPEVLTAKYDAAGGTITINFNEPMNNTAAALDRTKISVTDGTNSVALSTFDTFAWSNGDSTLTITLSSTKKSAVAALGANKTLNLAAGAVKDLAGNANAELTGKSLASATILTGATYDEATNKLTLNFNNAVDVDTLDLDDLDLLGSATVALDGNDSIETSADGTTVEITLAKDDDLDAYEASNVTGRKVRIVVGASEDVAGDAIATSEVNLTYVEDTTAPTLVSASYNETTGRLTLEFSEPVQVDDAADAIQISDSGIKFTGGLDTLDADGNEQITADTTATSAQILTFLASAGDHNDSLTNTASESLTSTTKIYFDKGAVKDDAGNEIAAVASANAIAIQYVDQTPPQLNAVATHISPKSFRISFNEKVTKATAENVANYVIHKDDNPAVALTPVSAVLASNGTDVTVTVDQAAVNGYVYTVRASNVQDIAGNVIGSTNNTASWTVSAVTDTTAPALAANGVTYTDVNGDYTIGAGDTIEFKFTEPVVIEEGISSADFDLSAITTPANGFGTGATFGYGETNDTIKVTLGTNSGFTNADFGDNLNSKVTTKIKDLAGNAAAAGTASSLDKPDTDRPTLETAVYADANGDGAVGANDTLTLTFNEALDTTVDLSTLVAGDFTLAGNDTFTIASAEYTSSNTVRITLASADLDGGAGSETYLAPGTSTIDVNTAQTVLKDLWGNEADASAAIDITSDDNTRPSLVSAKVTAAGATLAAGDTVEVTFSEAVTLNSAPTASEFVLYIGTSDNAYDVPGDISVNGNKITITVSTSSAWDGLNVADLSSFNLAGTSSVFDASGNAARIAAGFGVAIE